MLSISLYNRQVAYHRRGGQGGGVKHGFTSNSFFIHGFLENIFVYPGTPEREGYSYSFTQISTFLGFSEEESPYFGFPDKYPRPSDFRNKNVRIPDPGRPFSRTLRKTYLELTILEVKKSHLMFQIIFHIPDLINKGTIL